MTALTDLHCHILPGVDDGSASVEESLELLRMQKQQGITHAIATPHFYPDRDAPEAFLARRDRAEDALRREMAKHSDLPKLSVGAEVRFFRGIGSSEYLPRLTISGKRCILIEMPPAPWPGEWLRELVQIREDWDLIPIIAHIDRYISPLHRHGIPKTLEKLPVLVQANAEFFLRNATASMAMRMLKAGQIHLLGSDCHNTAGRKPDLGRAVQRIEKKLGSDVLATVQANYERIPDR